MNIEIAQSQLRPRFLPDREASTEWGLKGGTLATLIRTGLKTPPTAAFGQTQVRTWLETLPELEHATEAWRLWGNPFSSQPLDQPPAPRALERIRERILAAPMPSHFETSTETLVQMLSGGTPWPFLLRASETWPGTTDTIPAVLVHQPTAARLWEGFLKLVSGAFSEECARQVLSLNVDPRKFRFAVLVQPMLSGTITGRAFSRDPHDPWERELNVQLRTPSRAYCRDSEPQPKELTPFRDELRTYVGLAESVLGAPAALDWLWDGEQLWTLGAKPLETPEARLAARAEVPLWVRSRWLERFNERLSPLGWSVINQLLSRSLTSVRDRLGLWPRHPTEWAVEVRGIVYSDPELIPLSAGGWVLGSRRIPAPWKRPFWRGLAAFSAYVWRGLHGRGGALSVSVLRLSLLRAFFGDAIRALDVEWPTHLDRSRRAIGDFASEIRETRDGALIASWLERLAELGSELMRHDLSASWLKSVFSSAVEQTWLALDRDGRTLPELVSLTGDGRGAEMNHDWAECAAAISADPRQATFCSLLEEAHTLESGIQAGRVLGDSAFGRWRRFLERHGHCTPSWDVSVPTWKDDPSRLAPLARAGFDSSMARPAKSARLKAERRAELEQTLSQRDFSGEIDGVLRSLSLTETLIRLEEEHRYHIGLLLSPMRRLLRMAGEALVRRQSLTDASDVQWLRLEEIRDGLMIEGFALRFLAERRSLEWLEATSRSPASALPRPTPVPPPFGLALGSKPRSWQGIPMSPGRAVGPVRSADDLDDAAELEPGTILITRAPNPALAPLYPMLGGLISESGDTLSPGFVSAREYSIPIVTGLRIDRSRLRDGSLVRIDGASGRVQLLFAEEPVETP